jgi:hypothetical protein
MAPPKGMEKRSPWGGKVVDAVFADCFERRERALAASESFLAEVEGLRIKSAQELVDVWAEIEPPYVFEKLTAALLRCEKFGWYEALIYNKDVMTWIYTEDALRELKRLSPHSGLSSYEHLLADLVALWTNRHRDKRAGGYNERSFPVVGP